MRAKVIVSQTLSQLPLESEESARAAGLRYMMPVVPWIRRLKRGRGWTYLTPDGTALRDRYELQRIQSLVIPPRWNEVCICPSARGHLQAIGIDQRGRRQYRYHAEYRDIRDATKFTRMGAFGDALPEIRARVEEDLKRSGMPREKVLATIVRLLETTSIRVGNEEYAKQNESFGLTTLMNKHVEVDGSSILFRFRGKSGREHEIGIKDRRLARIVHACQEIPGQELFHFYDEDGRNCRVCSEDVNLYIKEIAGDQFTAKDFRTWNGSCEALVILNQSGPAATEKEGKARIVETVKQVAAKLGNRPATCRKYYIHPGIFESYAAGSLFDIVGAAKPQSRAFGLDRSEVALLEVVHQYPPKALAASGKTLRVARAA